MDIPLETLREAGYVRTETTETREIKRLRVLVQDLDDRKCRLLSQRNKALAEVERLRTALTLVEGQHTGCGGNLKPNEVLIAMRRICQQTLQGRVSDANRRPHEEAERRNAK